MELDRLAQGNKYGVTATYCIDFIIHTDVTFSSKITYTNFDTDYRPLKSDPYRIRCVVGGNKLEHMGYAGSPKINLSEVKLLLYDIISN